MRFSVASLFRAVFLTGLAHAASTPASDSSRTPPTSPPPAMSAMIFAIPLALAKPEVEGLSVDFMFGPPPVPGVCRPCWSLAGLCCHISLLWNS